MKRLLAQRGHMLKSPDLNVISVIDPSVDEVELRPQELLQVVLTDCKVARWRFENAVAPIRLRALRHETYYCDGINRNDESNFQVVSHIHKFGSLQQHFWFRINPGDYKAVLKLDKNYNELCDIVFYGENESVVGKATVWLLAEEEDKREYGIQIEQTILAGKDTVAFEAQMTGLANRLIDQNNGYILNPGWDEHVTFECRQRLMVIELAEPPHTKNMQWQAVGTKPAGTEVNFGITELTSRFINGVRVQRFLVKNFLSNLPVGVTKMRLGNVTFRLGEGHPRWDKKINFFIVRYREPDFHFGGEEEGYDEEEAHCILRQVENWCKPRPPRKTPVKIEELDIKGDLKAGARLIRVFTPKTRKVEIADPQDHTMFDIPFGEEFIIQLYKEMRYPAGEWKCELEGKLLKANYVISDNHRQRFFFEVDPGAKATGETLTFKMNDKVKRIHVTCSGHNVVQEVNNNPHEDKDAEKVISELLDHPTYEWRTVTSLSCETGIQQVRVVELLDSLMKMGKIRQHGTNIGLWGHTNRVG